ncbi:hypothetical protein E2605_07375 [Dysgonomonas capnocytophagoides]|uniref:Tyr recombinase domain-containing protein n=1 Tax=Dysgonomonas capnocytophagoides TaxID=45254 RepID=A0A4Y8L476_9BACT|nr:tyrosine-type recombinase/integrase [Dysgonomonas capnocytophagoides]TFD97479.1 hypothetical protein E2605_07375 [Dysgonomonas capnocytophagoides]
MELKKYNARFNLISSAKDKDEKQIFLIATIEGIKVYYYIGHRVKPENFVKIKDQDTLSWQVRKNTFNKIGEPASTINSRIRELENAAQIVFEQSFKGRDIPFSKDDFKKYLQIALGEYEEAKIPEAISERNIVKLHDLFIVKLKEQGKYYRYHQADNNKLVKFTSEYHQSNPETIDIIKYYKFLLDGRTLNTSITLMKRVRRFFNWMQKEKYINRNPFDEIDFSEEFGTEVYSEPICMTRDELTKLYNFNPDSDHKHIVKDMFCLQAAIGCRVGDYLRLTYNNIQNNILTYYPEKTDENLVKVVVPLSARAIEIINRYKGKTVNNLILPFMNSVEYNETLKVVFKDAEINRIVIWYDRDKKKEISAPLHEIATSHLARRTFVDILCQAGEPIHVVASMSGHSENSKAFDRYRRRPEQLQKEAVNRSMD